MASSATQAKSGASTLTATLGNDITAAEIANGDHGFFSYASGVASLETGGLTSAELLAALTNETGTGNTVFSASPTLTGTLSAAAATFSSTLSMSGSTANIALGSNYLSGDGGDEGVFVDSSGNVGIGTNLPQKLLHVYGVGDSKLLLEANDGGASSVLFENTQGNVGLGLGSDEKFHIGSDGSNPSGGSTWLTIDTSGNVGIGTTTPNQKLNIFGTNPQVSINESVTEFLRTGVGETDGTSVIGWDDSDSLRLGVYDSPTDTTISDLMTITSAGNIGIGTTTPSELLHLYAATNSNLKVSGNASVNLILSRSSSNASNAAIDIQKARGIESSKVIVNSGDTVGGVNFMGYDGAAMRDAAKIRGAVDGTPGAGDMPGRLMFFTTPDASVTSAERMRIDSSGRVGIGTTSPYAKLSVAGQVVGNYFTATSTTATSTFPRLNATQVAFGGDYITDFTGTGLTLSGSTLTATLGADIAAAEIANGDHGFFSYASGVASLDTSGLTSANLLAALTDETGSGNAVFSASPTFTGTLSAATATFSSTLSMSGSTANIALGSNYLSGDGGDEGIFVDSSGNAGIGTNSPQKLLHVYGAGDSKILLEANDGGASAVLFKNTQGDVGIGLGSDEKFHIGSDGTNPSGGGGTWLTIDTSGNVGIGTTTPNQKLTVQGNINLSAATGAIYFDDTKYLYASSTNSSIVFGENAGAAFNTGTGWNVAIGYEAARYASTSNVDGGVFIGQQAGYSSVGASNVIIGEAAGGENSGPQNIIMGLYSGYLNNGFDNIIFGSEAGYGNTGDSNSLISAYAGYSNTGEYNNMIGHSSGYSNTGNENNLVGVNAGYSNSGFRNNFIGTGAGGSNAGDYNNAFGTDAGKITTGSYNEFIGLESGRYFNGTSTVSVGAQALRGTGSFTAINNVALGYRAGYVAATGANNNILIGYQAADNLTTGNNNIIIGYDIDNVTATADNRLNIGNLIFGTGLDGTGTALASGNVGIGTTSPSYKLAVAGDINFTGSVYMSGTEVFSDAGGGYLDIFGGTTQIGSTGDLYINDIITVFGDEIIFGGGSVVRSPSVNQIALMTDGVDRLTVDNIGNVGIGDSSPDYKLDVETNDVSGYAAIFFNDGNATTRWGMLVQAGLDDHTAAGPSTLIDFQDGNGGTVGSITFGSSVTAYNTTSDERLKTNIRDTSVGISELMQVQVRDFNWKDDQDRNTLTHGFIAQELYEVYPQAVTVPANPEGIWMVDYSKLTPLLVKGAQELNLKLEDLATTTPFTEIDENSFMHRFYSRLVQWLGDSANGISRIFAREVETELLCVGKDGERTCLTKDQLDELLSDEGSGHTSNNYSDPAPSNDPPAPTDPTAPTDTEPIGPTQTEPANDDTVPIDNPLVVEGAGG